VRAGELIDYKKRDAEILLAALAELLEDGRALPKADCTLAETCFWTVNRRKFEQLGLGRDMFDSEVLDELRLKPLEYIAYRERAALRCALTGRLHFKNSDLAADDLIDMFRKDSGLSTADDFETWLANCRLDAVALSQHLYADAKSQSALAENRCQIDAEITNELRAQDLYPELAQRARAKKIFMAAKNKPKKDAPNANQLMEWFCKSRKIRHDFESLDDAALSLGFSDINQLEAVVRDEYYFSVQSDGISGV
jgi:hypothetical protein